MFKKMMMLLGSMTLAAVALAPATAQAEWTHEGSPIEEFDVITYLGSVSFSVPSLGSSFGCTTVWIKVAIHPEFDEVTEFLPTTSTCSGTGPVFSGCKLISDKTTGMSIWGIHTSETDITITDLKLDYSYSGCTSGLQGSEFKFSEVTLTPNNPEKISTVVLSGEQGGVSVTGHLSDVGGGTYGIS